MSPRRSAAQIRQQEITKVLEVLGVDRCVAFFRAANTDSSCMAIEFVNEQLDAGADLAAALLDGDEYGYHLDVRRRGRGRLKIIFGCVPGQMVGDGGEWLVEFDDAGHVVKCEPGIVWKS